MHLDISEDPYCCIIFASSMANVSLASFDSELDSVSDGGNLLSLKGKSYCSTANLKQVQVTWLSIHSNLLIIGSNWASKVNLYASESVNQSTATLLAVFVCKFIQKSNANGCVALNASSNMFASGFTAGN
eukprot:NODE_20_length_39102_cov_0.325513.p18 type:complete len:130 gc:universal NODE_20_length_39102_cov_0.325513:21186-21575(+)